MALISWASVMQLLKVDLCMLCLIPAAFKYRFSCSIRELDSKPGLGRGGVVTGLPPGFDVDGRDDGFAWRSSFFWPYECSTCNGTTMSPK